jgi:hypothetical protein
LSLSSSFLSISLLSSPESGEIAGTTRSRRILLDIREECFL